MSIDPRGYTVGLKDNNGTLITYFENKIDRLQWEWNRMGGCGGCQIRVREDWDGALAGSFAEDYEVNIYAPVGSGTAELFYSGYIDKSKPTVSGDTEFINVSCLGYVNQLKRCVVKDKTYSGIEISAAVKDLAQVYATDITSITATNNDDFEDTGFSADNLEFNESAYTAIRKLVEIAGQREWGVRADKSLFFLARGQNVTRHFNISEDFTEYKPSLDYNPIITRIFLEGGEGYSGKFTVTNRVTTREEIVQNSSITTQSVGQQFARMYLKDRGRIRRSWRAKIVKAQERFEASVPMGLAEVNLKRGIGFKYDDVTKLYDSGIKYDGGTESFQIERITYQLADDRIMATLYFDVLPPDLAEELDRFDYLLTNERNIK